MGDFLDQLFRAFRELFSEDNDFRAGPYRCANCPEAQIGILALPIIEGSMLVDDGVNELFRTPLSQPVAEQTAYRTVIAQFFPIEFFAGKQVEWTFVPAATRNIRGNMATGHPNTLEEVAAYSSTVLNANAQTAIRLNLPQVAFNKGTLTVTSADCECATRSIVFEVPAVVVIDAGHGGGPESIDGSDGNHATSWWPSGADRPAPQEKALTLDLAGRVAPRLRGRRPSYGPRVRVLETRTTDVNLGLGARANIARDNGADLLLSIHFNAFGQDAHGAYAIRDSVSNVNTDEDAAFGQRIFNHVFTTLERFYTSQYNRGVGSQNLGVLRDESLGNTDTTPNKVRACLLEVDFIDYEVFSRLWNLGEIPNEADEQGDAESSTPEAPADTRNPPVNDANVTRVRNSVAAAIVNAIVEDLRQQPVPWR